VQKSSWERNPPLGVASKKGWKKAPKKPKKKIGDQLLKGAKAKNGEWSGFLSVKLCKKAGGAKR